MYGVHRVRIQNDRQLYGQGRAGTWGQAQAEDAERGAQRDLSALATQTYGDSSSTKGVEVYKMTPDSSSRDACC